MFHSSAQGTASTARFVFGPNPNQLHVSACSPRGRNPSWKQRTEAGKTKGGERFRSPPWDYLVAPTGFEPATSALRGRRPKPLDDGATLCALLVYMKSLSCLLLFLAGVEGVEPSHTAPETAVLPLDDTPSSQARFLAEVTSASGYISDRPPLRQALFSAF